MDLDVVLLSRVQFALTIMFHYIFPPLSIGLGMLMVFMEGLYLYTGDRRYHLMTRFWTKIFAANFAMGVATGLVMEFQFGTNWGAYARYVGDIFGSVFSAVWIVIANSWQQSPVGYRLVTEPETRAVITDFWAVILSRVSMVRLLHTVLGAYIQGAFFVMSISAWYVLRGRHLDFAKKSF